MARQASAEGCPPALASVANRPLLAHALGWLASGGISEVAIVVPSAFAVEAREAVAEEPRLPVELRWLELSPAGTHSEALGALSGFLAGEPFVLHLADSLPRQDLASLVGRVQVGEGDAILVVHPVDGGHLNAVVDLRSHQCRAASGVRRLEREGWPFGGVALLGPEVAAAAAAAADVEPGREVEPIAEQVERLGGQLRTVRADDWWRFRADAEALLEGNRFALEGLRADYDQGTLIDSHIQGAVVIHPSARLASSVVRGPVIIGAGARLADAYIGPYTAIGRDVAIEGAEIEHSVILPGASISHLGGRLEASLVGPKARIFRDFRLPRALRLHVGEGAEVSVA